jgi:dTMP kinase
VGTLIVIEGLDGSGKNTLARALTERWRADGRTVATLAFPRYGAGIHADLVRDALYGRLGDLTDSVYGSALLFALDRRDAIDELSELREGHDIVLLDRYITSNAAYGAARLGGPEVDTGFPEWIRALEVDRFGIPVPDRQLLLATATDVAADRARARAAEHAHRALDAFESDDALQRRTAAMYRQLAGAGYLSPWTVLTPGPDGSVTIPDTDLVG